MNTGYLNIRRVIGEEENWTVELVVRIKNLCARETIPPSLSVAIDHTFAVDLDIPGVMSVLQEADSGYSVYLLATPHPESDALLEIVVEVVRLPIFDVVRELQLTLYIHIDVIQKG